jgi:hypothetical protein
MQSMIIASFTSQDPTADTSFLYDADREAELLRLRQELGSFIENGVY